MSEMEILNNPENPIETIVDSLRPREDARIRAVQLAWKNVEQASTNGERILSVDNLVRMMGALSEFQQMFPEVFPQEDD